MWVLQAFQKHMIGRLFLALILAAICVALKADQIISAVYTLSLFIREILLFCIPIIIASCIFNAVGNLPAHSYRIVFMLLIMVCGSNFFSSMVAYSVSQYLDLKGSMQLTKITEQTIYPWFEWKSFRVLSNEAALIGSLILALLQSYFKFPFIERVSKTLNQATSFFLKRFLLPVLPVFIAGFAAKMMYEGSLLQMLFTNKEYILVIFLLIYGYITAWYIIVARFHRATCVSYLKNVFPALVTAFCTMSSFAAMPLTLLAAKKNTQNSITDMVVPSTVNIHLVGDSIFIPMMAIIILQIYGMPSPDLIQYLYFAFLFVLSKFAVAAIPGGGIIVMLPILEAQFGFNQDMAVLITALYILLDPIITTANVYANNLFAILFARIPFRSIKTPS